MPIRRSFAFGEGTLDATTAAAAAVRCSISLIISVLTVVVMVCVLLCCFFCVATCSVRCCYTNRVVARELMECTCCTAAVVTIELPSSGVCALQALVILVSCGAVALPPPERGYLHLYCLFRWAHCCCELRVAGRVRFIQKATRTDVLVTMPPAPFLLSIQA